MMPADSNSNASMDLLPYRPHWIVGIEAFNDGRYWDAHEAWEQGWTRLPPASRNQIQGLIMGCASFIHLEKGRESAARVVARRCVELLALAEQGGVRSTPRVEIQGLPELLKDFDRAKILNHAKTLVAELVQPPEG
jgi:hypothetical protein